MLPSWYRELLLAPFRLHAIAVLHEFGVFSILAEGSLTLEELSRRTGGDQRNLGAVLQLATSAGLLDLAPPMVRLSSRLRELLSAADGLGVLDLAHLFSAYFEPAWTNLGELVAGAPPNSALSIEPPPLGRIESSGGELATYHSALHALALLEGQALAANLDWATRSRVLDVGGGTGGLALALLREHANLRVTCLDRPDVCALGRVATAAHAASDRISFDAIDIYTEPFGVRADVVLLSLVCNGAEDTLALLEKCIAILPDDGGLIIAEKLDGLPDEASAFARLNAALWAGVAFDSTSPAFAAIADRGGLRRAAEIRTNGLRDFLVFAKAPPKQERGRHE